MSTSRTRKRYRPWWAAVAAAVALVASLAAAGPVAAADQWNGSSASLSLSCTGSPCPWGQQLNGHAVTWPAELGAVTTRLGYTASAPAYLPAQEANGLRVTITSGSAQLTAGLPDATSHRSYSLSSGQNVVVSGLAPGEVLAVQGAAAFTWEVERAGGSQTPSPTPTPTPSPTPTPTPSPTPSVPPAGAWEGQSVGTSLVCATSACAWGPVLSGHGLVWPEDLGASTVGQSGYTAELPVYLDSAVAEGLSVTVTSGTAQIYVGPPDGAHTLRATISAGSTRLITGAAAGTVVSLQGTAPFSYELTADAEVPGEPIDGDEPDGPDEPEPTEPCTDTSTCDVVTAVPSSWECNVSDCQGSPWLGAAINWPEGTAYADNGRSGDASRTAFGPDGSEILPYMGPWADGCTFEVVWGAVLVVEWQRGTNVWRETMLAPGDEHTIDLVGDEDGALLEGYPSGFGVRLVDCAPQPLSGS